MSGGASREAFTDTSVPWTDVVSAEEVDSTNFDLRRSGKRISFSQSESSVLGLNS